MGITDGMLKETSIAGLHKLSHSKSLAVIASVTLSFKTNNSNRWCAHAYQWASLAA